MAVAADCTAQGSSDLNVPEKPKSHVGRIIATYGAVAVLALGVSTLSGCGESGESAADAGGAPAAAEQVEDEASVSADSEPQDSAAAQPEEDAQSSSGLTVDELVHELYPYSSISEAMSSDPLEVSETICDWLITDGGYAAIGAGDSGRASASFDEGGITIDASDAGFHIYITRTNPNGIYEYDSDFIPTAAEAEQIALEEIPQ